MSCNIKIVKNDITERLHNIKYNQDLFFFLDMCPPRRLERQFGYIQCIIKYEISVQKFSMKILKWCLKCPISVITYVIHSDTVYHQNDMDNNYLF